MEVLRYRTQGAPLRKGDQVSWGGAEKEVTTGKRIRGDTVFFCVALL